MLYRDEDLPTESEPAVLKTPLFVDFVRPCNLPKLTLFARSVPLERIHLDEEALASHFEENSHDCIMSCLSMHWVNDLPGEPSLLAFGAALPHLY